MRFLSAAVALVAVVLSVSCGAQKQTEADKNKEVVSRMVKLINARDYDKLGEVMSSDLVRHSAATPDVSVKSLDDMRAFLRKDNEALPDSVVTIQDLIAEGDNVAGRFLYEGTQVGAMGPFPATNKKVQVPYIAFLRMKDGKVAEMWVEWDNLAILTQLGHFPPGGGDGDKKQEKD